jgi:hypothetical protein
MDMTTKNATDLANTMMDRMTAINQLIAQVQAGVDNTVDKFKAEAKQGCTNWGYAGDLGHAVELLNELATFLGQPGQDAIVLPKVRK